MREFAKEIDVSYVKIEEVIGAGKRKRSGASEVGQSVGHLVYKLKAMSSIPRPMWKS